MATTYTWSVTNLYTIPVSSSEPDYVVTALYELVGVDGTYTSSISNSAQFEVSSEGDFIPYADLTNEIVISWVKEQLGVDGVANLEASIQGQIDSQINPPVSPENTPLPWN